MEPSATPTPEAAAPAAAPTVSMEAFTKLKGCFDPARWAKIEAQAVKQSENLPALCTRLAATSAARYPENDQAASYNAANSLLICLGSVLKPADVQRLQHALNPDAVPAVITEEAAAAPAVTADGSTPVVKKRGGKADAAPPPVS